MYSHPHHFLLVIMVALLAISSYSQLAVDYYHNTCPAAEKLIRGVVGNAIATNPGIGAGLIRLHFHDCFVRGCDGSVLLDSVDGKPAEKDSFVNKGLRGFEIVDEAKALLEEICPLTVSCADVLAYAARDAAAVLGGIQYNLPGGRRDGLVSIQEEVLNFLPAPSFNLTMLEKFFAVKGLAKDDLVILSGAHSIGQTQCSLIENRIRNFSQTSQQDPSMDPNFADALKTICPAHLVNSTTNAIPLDFGSPNRLDAGYYNSVLKHKVVFGSDQALLDNTKTRDMVKHYARHGGAWKKDFAAAMVRMGSIEVLVGEEGQIRRSCRVVNKD